MTSLTLYCIAHVVFEEKS